MGGAITWCFFWVGLRWLWAWRLGLSCSFCLLWCSSTSTLEQVLTCDPFKQQVLLFLMPWLVQGCMGSFGWSCCVSCIIFGVMVCLLSRWEGLLIVLLVCVYRCFYSTELACVHGEASTSSMWVSSCKSGATIEFGGVNLVFFSSWWGCCLSVYDVSPIFLPSWNGIKSLRCVNNGTS